VARVVRAHGVRGELRVQGLIPEVIDLAELLRGRRVAVRRDERVEGWLRVTEMRPLPDGQSLLSAAEIPGRSEAEALRGAELCLRRDELPSLPDGWFYEADVEGSEVLDDRRGPIGRVEGLELCAGRWLLVVETSSRRRVTVPWVEPLVREVDLEGGRVHVALPDEYPGLDGDETGA